MDTNNGRSVDSDYDPDDEGEDDYDPEAELRMMFPNSDGMPDEGWAPDTQPWDK